MEIRWCFYATPNTLKEKRFQSVGEFVKILTIKNLKNFEKKY